MLQDSGWWDRKSSTRQPSWTCFRGLGFRLCTRSTNLMPSRMKNTGMSFCARTRTHISTQPGNDQCSSSSSSSSQPVCRAS